MLQDAGRRQTERAVTEAGIPDVTASQGTSLQPPHWRHDLPASLRALATLQRYEYSDVFTAPMVHRPEGPLASWTHEAFIRAPGWVRILVPVAQRRLLGLRNEPQSSPERPLGWRIAEAGERLLRLESSSWCMSAELVVLAEDHSVSVGTLVRYDHPFARLLWPPVSLAHRLVGVSILRTAQRQVAVAPAA